MKRTVSQFLRFCIVGSIGFLIDTSILYLAVFFFGLNPFAGRIVSYLTTATTTWKLNRTYTFTSNASKSVAHREWAHYVTVNALGGAINYTVYALSILYSAAVREHLVIGVAAGSVAGLIFNFTLSKWWIFRTPNNANPLPDESQN